MWVCTWMCTWMCMWMRLCTWMWMCMCVCGDQDFQEKSEPLLLHLDSTYTSLCAMLPSCYRDAHGKFFCSVSFEQCLFLYVSLPPSSEHKNARFPLKRTHSQKGIAPTKSAHSSFCISTEFLHFRSKNLPEKVAVAVSALS